MDASSRLFVYLCAVFVSCLLLGDIIGGKTIPTPFGPISVGILPFPVTFLLTDVVNDFYGRPGARFLTFLGFWMAALAWGVLQLSTALPVDQSTYFTQAEFSKIFGGSAQLFVASMLAYLVSQLLDIQVFQYWKALTESRHLWLRATGSTVVSQLIDTVTINVVDVGYDNAYDKISVGLQAGTGLPDLLTLETERLPGYLENFPNGFVDLTSRVEPEKANLDPSKLAAATGKDGKILAMPWDSGTMALYLRSDYLSDAGIDPATLTSWDAFAQAAEQVKAKLGKTAFDTDLSTGAMFLQLLQQRGTGIFDANGKVVLDNDKAVAVLTFLQNLQQKGLINNTKGWDARVSAAKAGKSAFSPNAVWWTGTLTSEAKELKGKWRVQPLPTFAEGEAKTSNNGGSNLAVPAQAKNPALAADFATVGEWPPPPNIILRMSRAGGWFAAGSAGRNQPPL
mgnify:CR=1 FL=1